MGKFLFNLSKVLTNENNYLGFQPLNTTYLHKNLSTSTTTKILTSSKLLSSFPTKAYSTTETISKTVASSTPTTETDSFNSNYSQFPSSFSLNPFYNQLKSKKLKEHLLNKNNTSSNKTRTDYFLSNLHNKLQQTNLNSIRENIDNLINDDNNVNLMSLIPIASTSFITKKFLDNTTESNKTTPILVNVDNIDEADSGSVKQKPKEQIKVSYYMPRVSTTSALMRESIFDEINKLRIKSNKFNELDTTNEFSKTGTSTKTNAKDLLREITYSSSASSSQSPIQDEKKESNIEYSNLNDFKNKFKSYKGKLNEK